MSVRESTSIELPKALSGSNVLMAWPGVTSTRTVDWANAAVGSAVKRNAIWAETRAAFMSSRREADGKRALKDHEPAAAGCDDHHVHDEQHQVIMPAVRLAAPKAGLPHEDLLLNRAQHDEAQSDGGEQGEDAECDTHAPEDLGSAQKDGETRARPDALCALGGMPQVIPAAIEEDDGDHQSQEQETGIGELKQRVGLGVHVLISSGSLMTFTQSGRRDLNSMASVRGHCFIGT